MGLLSKSHFVPGTNSWAKVDYRYVLTPMFHHHDAWSDGYRRTFIMAFETKPVSSLISMPTLVVRLIARSCNICRSSGQRLRHISRCVFVEFLQVLYLIPLQNVQNDTGKLAASVARERELSAKFISDLATNISVFKNTPMGVTSKSDP